MKQVAAKVWIRLPIWLRRRLLWLTQARFTVGVSAVVLNDQNEILLLRHRFRETQRWELPGGLVGRREQLEAALRRELWEETGLNVRIVSLATTKVCTLLHVDVCFLARIVDGHLSIDPREVIEARFFPSADLPRVVDQVQLQGIDAAFGTTRLH